MSRQTINTWYITGALYAQTDEFTVIIKNIHENEIEPIVDGFCEAFDTEWAIIKADVDAVLDDLGPGLKNVYETFKA